MDDKLLQQKVELNLEQPIEKKEIEMEDIEKMEMLFPMLTSVHPDHFEALKEVVGLIQEIGSATYHSQMKYEMMWKIIKLGNLLEQILPENVSNGVNIDIARSANGKSIGQLDNSQQWSLFKVARDISADFSHMIYESDTDKFLNNVINLCQGTNTINNLLEIRDENFAAARGNNIVKAMRNNIDAQAKMFNQMGYFLSKAKTFIELGNIEAACMAFVNAGNCARFINTSKISQGIQLAVTSEILDIRKMLTHFTTQKTDPQKLIETVKQTYGKIDEYIKLLEQDAKKLNLNVNVETYNLTEKPTQEVESPRVFRKNL